jgi:hypothetical protein
MGRQDGRREDIATEPTLPAADFKGTLPDLSRERPLADDGRGSATTWVIVVLIALVAVAFWWLTDRVPKPPAKPPLTTSPAPPSPPAPAKHAVAPAPAKSPSPRSSLPSPSLPSPASLPSPPPLPPVQQPSLAPVAPAKTIATVEHPRHHKKKPAHKPKPVKLPRLPAPPPPD